MLRSLGLLAAMALAAAGAPAGAAPKFGPVAFQGLGGDSTRQQVLTRFPNARPDRKHCHDGSSVAMTAGGEIACELLALTPYPVGDTPFSASFVFLPTDKLRSVFLEYKYADEKLATQSALTARFNAVRNLLIVKYGQPSTDACSWPSDPRIGLVRMCSTWRSDAGSIEVFAEGLRKDKAMDAHSLARVSVEYQLVPTAGADRL